MSLLHWWTLNNETIDRGILNNPILKEPAAKFVEGGKTGTYSARFDNTSTDFYIYNDMTNVSPTQLSISIWVKLDSTQAGWGEICKIGPSGKNWNDIRFGLVNRPNQYVTFNVSDGADAVNQTESKIHSDANLQDDKWHHIAATYDNGVMRLYVDGNETASSPYTTNTIVPNIDSTATWIIAGSGDNDEPIKGNINDLRIYDHALSSEEVLELSQGLVAHYSFNWEEFYQPIEYIESTGTQYIDTGYYPKLNKTKIVADAEKEVSKSIFGAGSNIFTFTGGSTDHYAYYGGPTAVRTNVAYTDRHLYIMDKNNVYIDDTSCGTRTLSDAISSLSLYIFGRNVGNNLSDAGTHKLYGLKIFEDNKPLYNFIPVIRKVDQKPGLFDLVENKFYCNAGTSEFKYPSSTVEYEFLDYIEGTSNHQYVDTGWVPNFSNGWKVEATVAIPDNAKRYCIASNYNLQGATDNAKEVSLEINNGNNSGICDGRPRFWMNGGDSQQLGLDMFPWISGTTINSNKKANVEYSYNASTHTCYVSYHNLEDIGYGENTATMDFSGRPNKDTMLLFIDRAKRWSTDFYTNFKMYSCKIWDSNTLVRNYIPARRKSDGKIGMYDSINNVFANSTGSFTTNTDYAEPTGYKFIDYIEANEGQYINTEFKPNQDTWVQMSIIDSTSGAYYFGALTREGDTWWKNKAFCVGNDGGNVYTGYGAHGGGDGDIIPPGPHIIEQNKNITIVDGTERRTLTYEIFKCDYPLYLFAQNRSDTAAQYPQGGQTIKCAGCKIWDNNVLVRNFVPAIRLSDNRPGLYDLVNSSFYKNAGTGEFNSPALYHPVDYIASTGTQYINTNWYNTTNNYRAILTFSLINSDSNNQVLFGNKTGSGAHNYIQYGSAIQADVPFRGWIGNTVITPPKTNDIFTNEIYTVSLNRDAANGMALYIWKGKEVKSWTKPYWHDTAITTSSTSDTYPMYLFATNYADNSDNSARYRAYMRLYGCKITENSNSHRIYRDFIPVVRIYDNKPGLWEKVEGKFYTNQGTDEFIWSSSLDNYNITNGTLYLDRQKFVGNKVGDPDTTRWRSGIASRNRYNKCSASFTVGTENHHTLACLVSRNDFGADSGELWHYGYGIYQAGSSLCYAENSATAILKPDYTCKIGDVLKIVLNDEEVNYYLNDEWLRTTTNTKGELYPVILSYPNERSDVCNITLCELPDPIDINKSIKDNSGYDNDITIFTPDLTTTNTHTILGNQSLVFNGNNKFIKHEGELITGPFTVSVWAKTSSTANQCLFCDRGGTGIGPALFLLNGNTVRFDVEDPHAGWYTTFTYHDGEWHLYTATFDGENKKLYIDGGKLKTSITISSGLGLLGGCLSIGASYPSASNTTPNGNWFDGEIADWRLYNTALSEEAIKDLYEVKAKIYNNNTFAANSIKAIDQEAIKTFVPTLSCGGGTLTKIDNYWQFVRGSESEYAGVIIKYENFIADHYYKLSFDIKQIEGNTVPSIRGHMHSFSMWTNHKIYIDGQKASNGAWESSPDNEVGTESYGLEKLYSRLKHYDVFIKYNGYAEGENNNLYIQQPRGSKLANTTIYYNIELTDYGTTEPAITKEVEIATKTSELKTNNILLPRWIQTNDDGSPNKNSVYVSKNRTLVATDIKEI